VIPLVLALVVGLAVLETAVAPAPQAAPAVVGQAPASSGYWYCPVTAGQGESATLEIAAAGDTPSSVSVVRHTPDGTVAAAPVDVAPGTETDVRLEGDEAAQPLSLRWTGGPSVASWRVDGGQAAAAPCAQGPSDVWYVGGLDTAGGARSTLHLFNPFSEDAVADVTYATTLGPDPRELTRTILIEGESTRRLDLYEVIPEEDDLGAIVTVASGRLVVQGELTYASPLGGQGPTGRALVPAAPAPAATWAFGQAAARPEPDGPEPAALSWLSVLNPGDREAAVEVRVSDPVPGGELLAETTIGAGGVARIALDGVSAQSEFGVVVSTVNDEEVVVTQGTELRGADGRTGLEMSLGAAPAQRWAVPGGGTDGRTAELGVFNPGGRPVTVDVGTGEGAPAAWQDVVVAPNSRTSIDLGQAGPDRAQVPLVVTADGPVVAELSVRAAAGGTPDPLGSWSAVAVPATAWTGPTERPAVVTDPGLRTTPLGALPSPSEGPG